MNYFFLLALVLFVYMCAWFVASLIQKRNDIVDVAWGLGFVLMAWASLFLSGAQSARGLLVCILVSVWGLRLAYHIHARHVGRPEDFRYATWRATWGRIFYVRSFFQIYLLQGILLFLVVSPVLIVNYAAAPSLDMLDLIGLLVWAIGFAFESIGDAQLSRFIKDPAHKGMLMQSGLWAYTRHPNYFGEVTQWWGIWLIALSTPFGLFGIVGPLTITTLILFVSGVPLLEKKMSENPAFAEYKSRVSVFVPWFPKK